LFLRDAIRGRPPLPIGRRATSEIVKAVDNPDGQYRHAITLRRCAPGRISGGTQAPRRSTRRNGTVL
jgi:hypothetical protein